MDGGQNRYLSGLTMARSTVKKYLWTILGGVLTFFFGAGLLLALFGEDEALRADWYVILLLLAPSLLLLRRGLRAGRRVRLARQYSAVFDLDRDGTVELKELTSQTGRTEQQVLRELEELFRRGFFRGCSLRRDGAGAAVLLPAVREHWEEGFVTVVCPGCGASTRLRKGSRGRCEYCGGAIGRK